MFKREGVMELKGKNVTRLGLENKRKRKSHCGLQRKPSGGEGLERPGEEKIMTEAEKLKSPRHTSKGTGFSRDQLFA